ncbi:MAG TPA: cysteine--tRNA ligase [Candidatus Saccharimonadales bacterium]|nr:cysteine--tRNA ligase [Candidatus Saccharimonadales bacterium]
MKLYNTGSRKVEDFTPLKKDKISFYSCGPTVYDKPTIGNWASFIRYDILSRALRMDGYELDWIMNITDVGHLVSDADEGEDKLEKTARRESKTAWQIAEHYSRYFIDGLDYFNISIPKKNIVRATDYIDQQIELVKKLESGGHTYETSDGVYFDSTTFADYGKMARLDLSGQKGGARVGLGEKKHATDFALWKFSPKDKKRDMEWDSPWGKGFPGWHLECSAIALSELGETIDIHAGGIEHIPVHHTNEIAQSESATHKILAKFWVHNNHLQIDGQKISKSLGNGYTLEDLSSKGFNGLDFRMFVLGSNYRNESNFTWEILTEAKQKRIELQAAADLRYQTKGKLKADLQKLKRDITEAFDDNLNTSLAMSVLNSFVQSVSNGFDYDENEFMNFLDWLDNLLGLELLDSKDITAGQMELIKERNLARQDKDWARADRIRGELLKESIALKDTDEETLWYRTN